MAYNTTVCTIYFVGACIGTTIFLELVIKSRMLTWFKIYLKKKIKWIRNISIREKVYGSHGAPCAQVKYGNFKEVLRGAS
jgi:hypothetical protein